MAPPEKPDADQEWLNVPEFAKRLKVGERTAYRMIADGDVHYVKLGKGYQVPASEVARVREDKMEIGGRPVRKRRTPRKTQAGA